MVYGYGVHYKLCFLNRFTVVFASSALARNSALSELRLLKRKFKILWVAFVFSAVASDSAPAGPRLFSDKSKFVRVVFVFIPCETWFLQAGRYATMGRKPLRATVCFSIEHARPLDDYEYPTTRRRRELQKNNRFNKQNNNFARASRFYFCISLPFLHDYDVKMPNFAFYG